MSIYIVTVISQLLNSRGEVKFTVAEEYLPVEASSAQKASEAAVRYFVDAPQSKIYMCDEHPSQQAISSTHRVQDDCGHAVLCFDKTLRYVAIRALSVTRDELYDFYSMTCGLTNGKLIKGQ